MNALDLLIADHNQVRGLFTRFRAAVDADRDDEAATLAEDIFRELKVHTSIEEQTFYPRVHDVTEEVGEVVDEGLEEHHVVKVLMGEIDQLEPSDDQWKAKMAVLVENVKHHAEEEEAELFPTVRGAMAADDLNQLGADLEADKVELGAPTAEANANASVAELRDRAAAQEIPGRSTMAREELEATVAPE
ncbi:MAG: hemerythrin domain-containing protein [Acidimicrobiales bacterium]